MNHVLITGGTGLIGKKMVAGFVDKGVAVTFTTTNAENGKQFCAELGNPDGLNFKVVVFHTEADVKEFINSCKTEKYTHLINNARSLDGLKVDENGEASSQALASEYFMAVVVSYLLSVGFKDSLRSIVNISSMYGIVPPNKHLYENGYDTNPIQYGLAKAAQIQLSKELSVRLADKGIRVNTISYGGFEGRVDEAFKERYAKLCPLERMLTLDEVFGPVWFLCSNESSGMTGHNLVVDGGWSVW